mmetsp:Transcript_18529/g.30210  ORF Transcript_18529/g.30210 Transcript_18529/m.30210 type:complete len:352 (+) Transcript_18529:41-1096(+)
MEFDNDGSLIKSLAVGCLLGCVAFCFLWIVKPLVLSWFGLRYPPLTVELSSSTCQFGSEHAQVDAGKKRKKNVNRSLIDRESVDLSVVIETFNEDGRLSILLDDMLSFLNYRVEKDKDYRFEVIVVDNGSSDVTSSAVIRFVNKYGSEKVRLIRVGEHVGVGLGVREGVMSARGGYILVTDVTGETNFEDLVRLEHGMKTIETSSGEGVVFGSRAHKLFFQNEGFGREARSLKRGELYPSTMTILLHIFRTVFQVICVSDIYDTQCHFKLYSRRAARLLFSNQHLLTTGYECEILYLGNLFGIPLKEEAVGWSPQPGAPRENVWSLLGLLRDLIVMRLCYAWCIWRPNYDL